MASLEEVAYQIVNAHLGVKPGEQVLVLTDEWRHKIGWAIYEAARKAGAEAVFIEMLERENHGSELPSVVAAAVAAADVIIAPTSKSMSHTESRQRATARGARCASMPLVTEDMMGRALGANPAHLKRLSDVYAKALSAASTALLTARGGTECTFDLTGREAISDDGDLTAPGAFGNLPAGEAFIAPVEGKTRGLLVFDGSLSPDGALEAPASVTVIDGRITELTGGPAPDFMQLPEKYGPLAWEVAELGIGTNHLALITGNVLEDEKVASTVHVAFGNNATIGGSIDRVASHHDGVIRHVTLELDGRKVIDDGRLLLDP